jgi:hypothetical protein
MLNALRKMSPDYRDRTRTSTSAGECTLLVRADGIGVAEFLRRPVRDWVSA